MRAGRCLGGAGETPMALPGRKARGGVALERASLHRQVWPTDQGVGQGPGAGLGWEGAGSEGQAKSSQRSRGVRGGRQGGGG